MHTHPDLSPKGIFMFVDDDPDEHQLLQIAMEELKLKNQIHSSSNGVEAFEYLKAEKEDIFCILSDLNMPKMDGLEFKRAINLTPEISLKAIPFFLHSNSSTPTEVKAGYSLGIQGYFKKADSIDGTIEALSALIKLWTTVVHPNDVVGKG